jgi:DNA-binding NarL/FixJ family response regulator
MNVHTIDPEVATADKLAVAAQERRAAPGESALLRLFLVEDSALLRETVTNAISDPGRIEVVGHAVTESLAVAGINRCLPDVVVVDLCLREGNGLNVLRLVSQMIWIRLPVLIVLTNHPHPEFEKACRTLGADYFFDKSTEFDEFSDLLKKLAGGKPETPTKN